MGKRAVGARSHLIHEAARIICDESLGDYRLAKLKAAERLGFGANCALPSNADVEAAVIRYQRLFGGRRYIERLHLLRDTALRVMRLLAEFRPHLVGAVASGATTGAQCVQLHGFCDRPERIDLFLHERGFRYEPGARRYRYPEGRVAEQPTVSFAAGEVGVEVAIFPEDELRRPPLSPLDGLAMKRLDPAAVERLAAEPPEAWLP